MREHLSTLGAALQRAAIATGRALKRGALAALEAFESVLLSRSGRERIHATATFALIFAFAVTSMDFLITGGAEFGAPTARAQSTVHASLIAPARPNRRAEQSAPAEQPAALAPALAEATEANVIEVRQSFSAPLAEAAPAIEHAAPEARPSVSRGLIGGAALLTISERAGGADEAPKSEPAQETALLSGPKKD